MKNVFKYIGLSTLLMCFALFTGSAFGQSATTGSIEGTVTDTTGAAVPGAGIRVTSPNLISAQTASADDNGHYKIANLPPGRYTVSVEAIKGFAKFEN
jgi:protocatechuate 3,4-dioxygenase beta subunit